MITVTSKEILNSILFGLCKEHILGRNIYSPSIIEINKNYHLTLSENFIRVVSDTFPVFTFLIVS
jgi:hypothetical protein